jgi:hypothetical protein
VTHSPALGGISDSAARQNNGDIIGASSQTMISKILNQDTIIIIYLFVFSITLLPTRHQVENGIIIQAIPSAISQHFL